MIFWVKEKNCTYMNRSYLSNLIHTEINVLEVIWFIPPSPLLLANLRLCKFLKLFMIISLNSSEIEKCFTQTL